MRVDDNKDTKTQTPIPAYSTMVKDTLFSAIKSIFSFMRNVASKIIPVNYCPQPVCDVFSAFGEKLHAFKEAVVARCSRESEKAEDPNLKRQQMLLDNMGEFNPDRAKHKQKKKLRPTLSKVIDVKRGKSLLEDIENLIKKNYKNKAKLINLIYIHLIRTSETVFNPSFWAEKILECDADDILALRETVRNQKNTIENSKENISTIIRYLYIEYTLSALYYDKFTGVGFVANNALADQAKFSREISDKYLKAIEDIQKNQDKAKELILEQINTQENDLRIFIDVRANHRYVPPKQVIEDGYSSVVLS